MTFVTNAILYASELNALDAKADTGVTHAARTDNPHSTTAAQVGAVADTNTAFGARMLTWFNALPTTLPGSSGVLWNNGGTLAQS